MLHSCNKNLCFVDLLSICGKMSMYLQIYSHVQKENPFRRKPGPLHCRSRHLLISLFTYLYVCYLFTHSFIYLLHLFSSSYLSWYLDVLDDTFSIIFQLTVTTFKYQIKYISRNQLNLLSYKHERFRFLPIKINSNTPNISLFQVTVILPRNISVQSLVEVKSRQDQRELLLKYFTRMLISLFRICLFTISSSFISIKIFRNFQGKLMSNNDLLFNSHCVKSFHIWSFSWSSILTHSKI